MLLISFPNNPTGAIMEKADLEAIREVVLAHDLFVITDEIYAELTYGKKHVSIAALPDMYERCVVLNGFSKAFAMTGWRMGIAAGPAEVIFHNEQDPSVHDDVSGNDVPVCGVRSTHESGAGRGDRCDAPGV